MTTYKDLLAQKAQLESQIAQAQAEHKAEGVATARALIREHGLTTADVFPRQSQKTASKVGVAKYRDPATGATWTGRGKPPTWIVGKDRTTYQIS
ncbi:H-NS family nucleoid-associated regulatory protein [Delftia acidovorans]|uniref:H-NS histone family protein n=1 Tax=Delftia acidovorans TaxID=80866 RepID=UPI00192B0F30|nr:H-NS histone family protein [Delftia acidovorans]